MSLHLEFGGYSVYCYDVVLTEGNGDTDAVFVSGYPGGVNQQTANGIDVDCIGRVDAFHYDVVGILVDADVGIRDDPYTCSLIALSPFTYITVSCVDIGVTAERRQLLEIGVRCIVSSHRFEIPASEYYSTN